MTSDEAAVCMDMLLGCKSEGVALTREAVARMLAGEKPGALLRDHAADLAEAYYVLCAVLGWTFVMDSVSPKHQLLRAARYIAETRGGPYNGNAPLTFSDQEMAQIRRAFSPALQGVERRTSEERP